MSLAVVGKGSKNRPSSSFPSSVDLSSAAPSVLSKAIEITVRKMDFEFGDEVPDLWFDDDPFMTLFFSTLSAGFPPGEKQFIQSVRNYQSQIKDPVLKKQIKAFIGQEGHHSKEHNALNVLMKKRGFPLHRVEKRVTAFTDWLKNRASPKVQLINTVCAEHITAILADYFMRISPQDLELMDESVRKIWAWHVVEETEHKAVAFDVYREAEGDENQRRIHMFIFTFLFALDAALSTSEMMVRSGYARDWKSWLKAAGYFWGPSGMVWKLMPAYLAFYRKDFHPWQQDTRAELEAMKAKWLED